MDPARIINYASRPEAKIQNAIRTHLELHKWYVKVLHGNAYQTGMPDLFVCKRSSGWRFIEVKQPEKYMFTSDQCETFPKFAQAGVGIWVMTAATPHEYSKLFLPANWHIYFTPTHMRSAKTKKAIPPKPKGPEAEIQEAVIKALEKEGWFCKVLHGDMYQNGFPDLFVCKKGSGFRFVEIKNPKSYRFTGAQYECFPRLMSEGVGIWILGSDFEIKKLDGPPNWMDYLKGAQHDSA